MFQAADLGRNGGSALHAVTVDTVATGGVQRVDPLAALRRERNEHQRRVYEARKLAGLCTDCGKPVAEGSQYCRGHGKRRRQIAAQWARQRRARRKRGRCRDCNRKSPTARCARCQIKAGRLPRSAMPVETGGLTSRGESRHRGRWRDAIEVRRAASQGRAVAGHARRGLARSGRVVVREGATGAAVRAPQRRGDGSDRGGSRLARPCGRDDRGDP